VVITVGSLTANDQDIFVAGAGRRGGLGASSSQD
jgi:hypothetical protein